MKPQRVLFLSDIHFPFHDKKAWTLTLKTAPEIKPDVVFLGGDIVDFYAVSHFMRDPRRVLLLQDELDTAAKELRRLRSVLPEARFYMRPGNHEARLDKFKMSKAVELAGLRCLNLPELLDFKDLDIEYIPYKKPWKLGELYYFHGDEYMGGAAYPAKSIYQKFQDSMIVGHYHRSMSYIQRRPSQIQKVICNPCLCDLDPEYTTLPNWQQGATVLDYSTLGTAHPQFVLYYQEKSKLYTRVDGKVIS